jgi:hypothetical protein
MTETKSNEQIYELVRDAWSSLEDHAVGAEERSLALKAQIEKIEAALRHFAKRITDIEFAIYRLANPGKKRPTYPNHDGDIVGGYGD